MSTTRTAIIDHTVGRQPLISTVERYMPSNYTAKIDADHRIIITGEDVAGWTLDGYVIPRLASGGIYAKEVEQ